MRGRLGKEGMLHKLVCGVHVETLNVTSEY